MRNILVGIIVGLLVGGAVTWTVLRHTSPPAAAGEQEKEKKAEPKEESRVQHGTNGEVFVKLDKTGQAHISLKVAALESAQLSPELKGYGHVLDPTPFATLIADGATARASLDASSKEYQRLKTLYQQNQNVSSRDLETAEANMKRDAIKAETVQTQIKLALGKAASGQSDLPAFLHNLVSLKTALVRVDLPLGQSLQSPPKGGHVATFVSPENPLEAAYLGPVASADPQTQGQGFLFLLRSNLPPSGAAMIGWLEIPGDPQKGVLVPREALLRHEGETFVYVQTGEESFQRKEIDLERPLEKGWFVRDGLAPGEKVVMIGAQELLSEELKGQGGEE